MKLGDAIKNLRKNSVYHQRTTFSKRVGISREALRKIEEGISIPNKDTLIDMLDAIKPPQSTREQIMRIRDEEAALKHGINVNVKTPTEKIDQIVERLVNVVDRVIGSIFTESCNEPQRLLPDERTQLAREIRLVVKEEMNARTNLV